MSIRLLGIHIANGFSPEARIAADLLAHRDKKQIEAHVLCHQWPGDGDTISQFQKAAQSQVHALDFGWRSIHSSRSFVDKARARLQFIAALPRALALAREINPDMIYSSQQAWDSRAASYLARKIGKPQIIHLHYTVGPWLHKPVLDRLRTCDHVIVISDFIREEALRHGVAPGHVTIIRNTIAVPPLPDPSVRDAVRRELGLSCDAPVLGIVARVDPQKGQADSLRALAEVIKTHPGARLLVVGEETPWHAGYLSEMKSLAAHLGVSEHALFLGRRADVPRLLAAMDIFIHPSRQEPFGLAVAEAAASGLPVIVYAEGGAQEMVDDGKSGFLVPAGEWAGLARAAACLIDDPDNARAMGRAGHRKMETKFRPEEAGRLFSACLLRLLGTPTPC